MFLWPKVTGYSGVVRVKGWSKSPPRFQQWKRHGKPRREQGQAAEGAPPASKTVYLTQSAGWSLEQRGNSLPRWMMVQMVDISARIQNPAYRSVPLFLSKIFGINIAH